MSNIDSIDPTAPPKAQAKKKPRYGGRLRVDVYFTEAEKELAKQLAGGKPLGKHLRDLGTKLSLVDTRDANREAQRQCQRLGRLLNDTTKALHIIAKKDDVSDEVIDRILDLEETLSTIRESLDQVQAPLAEIDQRLNSRIE